MENLTIDGEEIEFDSLGQEGKVLVNRLVELKTQLGQVELQQQELHLLINAYAASLKNSIHPVEEEDQPEEQVM
jgi:hypothetical protein